MLVLLFDGSMLLSLSLIIREGGGAGIPKQRKEDKGRKEGTKGK